MSVGAACLFAGIIASGGALAIAGAVVFGVGILTTTYSNNKYPKRYQTPKNGDLGIKREHLDVDKSLEHIGYLRTVKKHLKKSTVPTY